MADWDANSAQLNQNIVQLLETAVWKEARERQFPSALTWHRKLMKGLDVPRPNRVGVYRGKPGPRVGVRIGDLYGIHPDQVAGEIRHFETILKQMFGALDQNMPVASIDHPGFTHSAEQLDDIIELCAWAHAEWVRIHPFVNGNGRIARIWANYIARRYGLPAFIAIRPRPHGRQYGRVGRLAMQGNWEPTIELFRQLLNDQLREI